MKVRSGLRTASAVHLAPSRLPPNCDGNASVVASICAPVGPVGALPRFKISSKPFFTNVTTRLPFARLNADAGCAADSMPAASAIPNAVRRKILLRFI